MNFRAPSRKKNAIYNLTISYLLIGVNMVGGIALVPFYLTHIDASLYGLWLATGNVLVILTLFDPGIGLVIEQKIAHAFGRKRFEEIGYVLSSGIFIASLITVGLLLVFWLLSPWIPQLLGAGNIAYIDDLSTAFFFAGLGSSMTVFSFSLVAANRGMLNTLIPGLSVLLSTITYYVVVFYLVLKGFGILSFGIAALVRPFINIMINGGVVYKARHALGFNLNWSSEVAREVFGSMGYTFLIRAFGLVAGNSDKIIMSRYLGVDMLAAYGISQRIPILGKTILERIINAIMPALSHLDGGDERGKLQEALKHYFKYISIILILYVSGLFAFSSDFIALWVGGDLFVGSYVILAMGLGFGFSVLFNGLLNFAMALGEFKKGSHATVTQSIITLLSLCLGAALQSVILIALAPAIGVVFGSGLFLLRLLRNTAGVFVDKRVLLDLSCSLIFVSVLVALLRLVQIENWLVFGLYLMGFLAAYLSFIMLIDRRLRSCLFLSIRSQIFKLIIRCRVSS